MRTLRSSIPSQMKKSWGHERKGNPDPVGLVKEGCLAADSGLHCDLSLLLHSSPLTPPCDPFSLCFPRLWLGRLEESSLTIHWGGQPCLPDKGCQTCPPWVKTPTHNWPFLPTSWAQCWRSCRSREHWISTSPMAW